MQIYIDDLWLNSNDNLHIAMKYDISMDTKYANSRILQIDIF